MSRQYWWLSQRYADLIFAVACIIVGQLALLGFFGVFALIGEWMER